ncbi:MAG: type II toxin-antitoxin system PemK/MazF family toxin [Ancrocorticia sp.]|uniref:type II toxin-antitoxin system PemK/MazF family toxin n=1 Tax=Ancrocorticia sp. TaxID=2593684 RepID=UPI003F8EFDC1
MREIRLAQLDKVRPVVVLTREPVRTVMTKVTIAPITSTVKGLTSELQLGPANGLDHECAASLDNIVTIRADALGKVVGYVLPQQESSLARAFVLAFDLDVSILG